MHNFRAGIVVMGVFLALVCWAGTAIAAAPGLINYQGRLNTPGGSPVADGSYQIKFIIYDTSTGGTALWNSGPQPVTVTGGLFTYVLGQDVVLPNGLFSSGSNRWLGVTVGLDPEIAPRTQLISSPYALHAQRTDSVAWTGITNIPAGFADGVDNDAGGDITGVTAGTGLSGGGSSGTVAVSADATYLQRRVTGTAAAGSAITGINGDGTVTTATVGDITDITAGTGLSGGGTSGSVALSADATYLQRRVTGTAASGSGITGINADGTVTTSSFGNISGNIDLPNSTASVGNVLKSGTRFIHNFGSANTFVGVSAGNFTMVGASNTGVGGHTLENNSIGNSNSAFGANALAGNISGTFNTAVGASALSANVGGFRNTAIGYTALSAQTGGDANTAVGNEALTDNATGNGNSAVGSGALKNNIGGASNVAVGATALDSNTVGNNNCAVGSGAMGINVSGNFNTAVGSSSLGTLVSGQLNVAVGYSADVSSATIFNSVALGANTTVNASNKIRLGNASVTVIEGQVAYTFTSDKNQKENFRPVDGHDVLSKLRGMSLTSWNYKGQDPSLFRHYGPVAQEFYQAFGHDEIGSSGTETTINSGDQAGILMIAVQTLTRDNDRIQSENRELKAAVAALQSQMDALRNSIAKK